MEYPTKEYEIWIGYYNIGHGGELPSEPQLVDKVVAPNFGVACTLHELSSQLESIRASIKADEYVSHQSCRSFYDFDNNKNDMTGKYFETKVEAAKTFK